MTEGQLRRARKLIRRLCANYDEGNCWPWMKARMRLRAEHFLLPSLPVF